MPFQRDHSRRLLKFARELRSRQTDAERKLWTLLRSRRLSGFKFRRQVPAAGYILDFYCMKAGVAVELDGGQHLDPEGVRYDSVRTQCLAEAGIRVIRFPDDVVLKEPDVVCEAIYKALVETGPSST